MNLRYFILLTLAAIFCCSCEEEFTPEISTEPLDLVVEGYIEAGENPNPPYVLLTRSVSFFSEVNPNDFNDLFVHDAKVCVSDGTQTTTLTEVCLNNLTDDQREIAAELFGLDADSLQVNFCVYLDLTFSMMGEVGKTYELTIEAEDKTMTASTMIPPHVPLDSIYFVDAPGEANDTLRQMRGFITDPSNEANYYRVFSGINDEGVFPNFNSITDDAFFDGLEFEFILPKSLQRGEEFDPSTSGLYVVGDTAVIKWTNIDEEHYNFWNTLEFNAANQGPFSSYTRIESNVNGGIGIWGGYSVSFYEILVE